MCFSAAASFSSGVLLSFIGTETVRKVHKPSQIGLASIPLFFAFQQFAEGVLWLVIGKAGHTTLQSVSTYLFIIMAEVVWPVLVPFSVFMMEQNKIRKRILFSLLTLGVGIALYYLFHLISFDVHAIVKKKHLIYQSSAPDPLGLLSITLYLVTTIAPLFVSSIKRIYVVGIVMGLSFVASALFYKQFVISVWCFFAAVGSFVIFHIIRQSHQQFRFSGHKKAR